MRSSLPALLGIVPLAWLLSACGTKTPGQNPASQPNPGPQRTSPSTPWKRDALVGEPEGNSPVSWEKTPSGLEYLAIQPGTGRRPGPSSRVQVHYHGYLQDGTVFDSSLLRGEPSVFSLDRVIPGWTEGLQLMEEGAKYRFRIPPHLAYGDRGFPPKIAPGQTLMFDLQLLSLLP